MERRPELRRSITLSEQLSMPDPAIREFLKIPNDGLYVESERSAADGGDSNGMSNWKPLRDRLRLRRTANAWPIPSQKPTTTTNSRSNKYIYAQGEATAAFSRTTSLRQNPTFLRATSTRIGSSTTIGSTGHAASHHHDDDEEEEVSDDEEEGKDDAPAAQMSLMALLEQSDSQWDDDDEEEDDHGRGEANKGAHGDEDEDEGRDEEMVHVCCVCMVRHKGAAFVPCGHTFCRLCSRELWVSSGNCPLCNGFIQEILDIF